MVLYVLYGIVSYGMVWQHNVLWRAVSLSVSFAWLGDSTMFLSWTDSASSFLLEEMAIGDGGVEFSSVRFGFVPFSRPSWSPHHRWLLLCAALVIIIFHPCAGKRDRSDFIIFPAAVHLEKSDYGVCYLVGNVFSGSFLFIYINFIFKKNKFD